MKLIFFQEPCSWVQSEMKLSCSGRSKEEKAQILSWTITQENDILVKTPSEERIAIDPRSVQTLNIDTNRINGSELKKFVSYFPNLQENIWKPRNTKVPCKIIIPNRFGYGKADMDKSHKLPIRFSYRVLMIMKIHVFIDVVSIESWHIIEINLKCRCLSRCPRIPGTQDYLGLSENTVDIRHDA